MLGLSIDWVLNMVLKEYDVPLIMNLICGRLTLVTILIIELYVWTVMSYLIIYLGIYIGYVTDGLVCPGVCYFGVWVLMIEC